MSVETEKREVKRGIDREEIISRYLPYVKYTALRLSWRLPPHMTVEDLMSAGIMGLLNAVDRYREDLGALEPYVKKKIRWAMLDELRANDELSRSAKDKVKALKEATSSVQNELGKEPDAEEVAERMGVSVEEYYQILQKMQASFVLRFEEFSDSNDGSLDILESIEDKRAIDPLSRYEMNSMKEALKREIENLSEREKLVLSLYYWEELTMKEIAVVLGVTEGRVSQIHHQALLKLRARMSLWRED